MVLISMVRWGYKSTYNQGTKNVWNMFETNQFETTNQKMDGLIPKQLGTRW